MRLLIILCSLILSCHCLFGIGRRQSVAVQGRLLCDGRPAANVKVKLYEKDVVLDSLLDQGRTNSNGEFRLAGSKSEISTIDPKVNVYHRCDYVGVCYRKFGITIPDNFVSKGRNPSKTYDIGTINLGNKFNGETKDCFN